MSKANQIALAKIRAARAKQHSAEYYVKGILDGNITVLSQAITLVESNNSSHRELAQDIIEKCLPHSGNSIRVGITGVPGVGKSTFIESFGKYLTTNNHKLCVLAIDPSSQKSSGSILGDKTRMEELAADANAYIRPSPSAGSLGGVAQKTRETIVLCEAAGFDVILVETVGVGQSEIAVHSMCDFFLLLMLAGAGDELQGIKRGIMEMADAIAITKADGDNAHKAKLARREYKNAIHLFPATETGWIPKVETISSIEKEGMETVWKIIEEFKLMVKTKGFFDNKRQKQAEYWLNETIFTQLNNSFLNNSKIAENIDTIKAQVVEGKISPFKAANLLMELYKNA